MAEAKGAKSSSAASDTGSAAPASGPASASGGKGGPVRFKNIWPIPALALGAILFIGGFVQWMVIQPKPPADIPLEQAKALVQEKRYQEAINKLNSREVRNFLDYGSPTEEHLRAFHLARARAFAGAQSMRGLNRPENHRSIVEDFEKAEKHGEHHDLAPTDISFLTESLIALDEIEGDQRALKRIESLPESEAPRKTRLTRQVVEHDLAESTLHADAKRSARVLDLLAKLAADTSLPAVDKAWVLARQGEMLLAAGKPEDAINRLIRRVGLLKDVPSELQGELYLLLGKAYFQSEQPVSAMRQLEVADTLIGKSSPLRADLGVLQGRLAQSGVGADGAEGASDNDPSRLLEFAREKFEGVISEFSGGHAYARAVLGVAEVEAALRHDDKSLEKYAELVEMVKGAEPTPAPATHAAPASAEGAASPESEHKSESGKAESTKPESAAKPEPEHAATPKAPAPSHAEAAPSHALRARPRDLGEITRERVTTSLTQRFEERFNSDQRDSALRYATMAESLYADADVPPEVLSAIGKTRRAMGDHLLADAREAHAKAAASGLAGAEFSVSDMEPKAREQVRQQFVLAGDYLRRHAKAVAATDQGEASKSLWTAADSYDRAGDMEEAQKAFADYAAMASDTDPNRAAAKFRLAQVYQARQDYPAAATLYRELVSTRDAHDPTRSAGDWSDRSVVPLAQCLLSDSDPANDAEAEQMLIEVFSGSRFGPDAPAFLDAKIELGTSYYRREQFKDAIDWLDQAVRMSKDDKRVDATRYLLADSHRREGVSIGKSLATQRLPQGQMDRLESIRVEHLRTARTLYDAVRLALEAKDPRTLTTLEKTHLRNSYFYAGDCDMELKDYDGAIAAYDAARLKYTETPASLVAMAQIVTAYVAQEKWAEARTANERARQQLAKFPESVWQDPDLPMEKRHWEQWLNARNLIGQQQATPSKE